MKAAVVTALRSPLALQDLPEPEPGSADAVVRVEACGVCRSDWHLWQGDWTWVGVELPLPFVLGHEFGGTVLEVGPAVRTLKPGDRVTVPFHPACGRCANCYGGRSNLCLDSVGLTAGGFGELALIRDADVNAISLPEGVDALSAAALGCRFMTAYHGLVDRVAIRPGEWVAVFGAGGVGLSAVHIAAALGARVVAVDISEEKLSWAREVGALATVRADERSSAAVKELTGGGADVSVDALGAAATALPAIGSLRKGGRHLQIGLTGRADAGTIPLPSDAMTMQEIAFITSLGCPVSSYPGLLALVALGRLNPTRLVSRTLSLEEVSEVLEAMSTFGTVGLTVVTKW